MSVTYSETGSNYTYLDANNLPVDYDSSKPHIRHLAYYISQKTPSKKTRIVDVRVALLSYIDINLRSARLKYLWHLLIPLTSDYLHLFSPRIVFNIHSPFL